MVLRGDAEDLGGGVRKEKKKKEKKNKVKKGSHSFAEVDEVGVKKKKKRREVKEITGFPAVLVRPSRM